MIYHTSVYYGSAKVIFGRMNVGSVESDSVSCRILESKMCHLRDGCIIFAISVISSGFAGF